MVASNEERRIQEIPLGLYIAKSPTFWFLCVITFCIILTWLRLRSREVFPEVLSEHAIRLHFKYRPLEAFYGVRVSTNPLFEWHAFATIPDSDENGENHWLLLRRIQRRGLDRQHHPQSAHEALDSQ